MATILGPLLPHCVLVAEMDPRGASPDELPVEEQRVVERAVDQRRREFAAGRILARGLLSRLGIGPEFVLVPGPDRVPIWPEGIVGSITHCRDRAAVSVGRASEILSVGCDLEIDEELSEALSELVCTRRERSWLARQPHDQRGHYAKVIFCAKEATYKALFPLTRHVLEFDAMEIELDVRTSRFVATLLPSTPTWSFGRSFAGRYSRAEGLIACAVTLSPS